MVAEPVARNNSVTFTGFLHRLDQCTDPRLNIHLIMDNGSSHTSRATRAWIAAHPRITVTCTPKHASWLDMAELWFSVLTRGLLRRGEFTSRTDLTEKITSFAIRYNQTAKPWTWAYDARDDHARYRARHSSQHPAQITAQPLPLKPSRRPRNGNDQSKAHGDLRQAAAVSRGVPAVLARASPQPIPE